MLELGHANAIDSTSHLHFHSLTPPYTNFLLLTLSRNCIRTASTLALSCASAIHLLLTKIETHLHHDADFLWGVFSLRSLLANLVLVT